MRVTILGAGAMGSVFGGYLKRDGHDVTLVDRNVAHVEAIRSKGLMLQTPTASYTINIPAFTEINAALLADLVIFFVDSNATTTAAADVPTALSASGSVLTLQNGIGNVEALVAAVGQERVLAGCTYVSAAMIAPGHVRNTNIGDTVLGEAIGGTSRRGELIAAVLTAAGFPCHAEANVMGHIWFKFALNCALNPLSAITGLRTGEIARHPDMAILLDGVISEILTVARAKGLALPEADPAQHIREHAWLRYNRPSMLQHVEAGRLTEIGSLNGALLREAQQLGIDLPINATVTALIRGIEARAKRGSDIDENHLEHLAACEAQVPG